MSTENENPDDFFSAIGVDDKTVKQQSDMLQAQLADMQRQEQNTKQSVQQTKKPEKIENLQASGTNIQEEQVVEETSVQIEKQEVIEEKTVVKEEIIEKPVEEKPVKKPSNKKKSERKVEIVSPEQAIELKNKDKKPTVSSKVELDDDFDARIIEINEEISRKERAKRTSKDVAEDLTVEKVNQIITESYESSEDSSDNISVEIVKDESEPKSKKPDAKNVEETSEDDETTSTNSYHGGDGKESSFKIRTAKVSKILRNINIDDTEKIDSTDIAAKTAQERQNIYLKTVLPTLQPSVSVVPFIISGVVMTMSAFTWPDTMEILKIEDKIEELDPDTVDYIYDKNRLFIEKRRKQLDIFYKHIQSVSGFDTKPSQEKLFGEIIKFPDFQQLFFAAYSASFLKAYDFNIVCNTCGTDNTKFVNSKDLCFLLNNNINIKQLNRYIEKGYSLDHNESTQIFNEFQHEKIVELANKTYRTSKKLPVSAFIYDLKIPSINDALDTMEEIIEVFRDRDLSYTDPDSGNTAYIDSSFGLTPELIELRNYLYINALIVATVVSEDKETNTAKVSFVNFKEKQAIINSIFSLSAEDYRTLIKDENLRKLVRVTGIRHAIKAGHCSEPTCKADLSNIPVEPETLFFMIARREYE